MAIVTLGVVGVIGTAITGGIGLFNAHENRKMQEKFMTQQNEARNQSMQLLMAMQQQNQGRQAQLAMFLQKTGNGDIAQKMLGNFGQQNQGGQGPQQLSFNFDGQQQQNQQLQFPFAGNFPGQGA